MKQHKNKTLTGLKIVDEDEGKVQAVFSRFGVKDLDGDVTVQGAFTDGAEVRISAYNHESWKDKLPVGKGVIHQNDTTAVLDGQFFLDTQSGRETFTVVKHMQDLQEWSYGYDVLDSEMGVHDGESVQFLKALKVHEVSPVILGAGIGTGTLSVKSGGLKFAEHVASVVAEVDELVKRAEEVKALRVAKGQDISSEALDAMGELPELLKRLSDVLARGSVDQTTEAGMELIRVIRRDLTGG